MSTPEKAEAVNAILAGVRKRKPTLGLAADLLEETLLIKPLAGNSDYNQQAVGSYQRCMQFMGPLMANRVEDTLMYTYTRFIGHGEVGDSSEFFGLKIDDFHKKMLDRQAQWPIALNATSTHDTKRGENVRCRLNIRTELVDEWFAEVETGQKLTRDFKQKDLPDVNDEYFIYQTLVGAYPMPPVESSDKSRHPVRTIKTSPSD